MTRINAHIPPVVMSDQHLIAEHREIKRLPKYANTGNIPPFFKLGKGHVKFFTDKQGYTRRRYLALYAECKRRGFNVTDFSSSWVGVELTDWKPP